MSFPLTLQGFHSESAPPRALLRAAVVDVTQAEQWAPVVGVLGSWGTGVQCDSELEGDRPGRGASGGDLGGPSGSEGKQKGSEEQSPGTLAGKDQQSLGVLVEPLYPQGPGERLLGLFHVGQ